MSGAPRQPWRSPSVRKVLAVARHEFITTVTRVGYLLTLIGLPLLVGATSTLSGLIASRAMMARISKVQRLGIVDETGLFKSAPLRAETAVDADQMPSLLKQGRTGALFGGVRDQARSFFSADLRRFSTMDEALAPLLKGELDAVVRIPRDWVQGGRLEQHRRSKRGLDLLFAGNPGPALRGWLIKGLLEGRVEPEVITRAARPADWTSFAVDAAGHSTPVDAFAALKPLLVPMVFALLLLLSIFVGGSYLVTGLVEEKQNRALELLLTSLTAEQLFWGKLLGLWLAALLQFLLYLAILALPALLAVAALGIRPVLVLEAFSYFVLGFFFFGSLLLAVGAVGNTQRYAQQLSGLITFPATLPFLALPLLLDQPDGPVARVLTFIPFTAPITGMLRAASGALPWWEFLLSAAALGLWTAGSIRICSRIFRVALLASGSTPGLAQLWRWAREAR